MSDAPATSTSPGSIPASPAPAELAAKLIRNFHELPLEHLLREPLFGLCFSIFTRVFNFSKSSCSGDVFSFDTNFVW